MLVMLAMLATLLRVCGGGRVFDWLTTGENSSSGIVSLLMSMLLRDSSFAGLKVFEGSNEGVFKRLAAAALKVVMRGLLVLDRSILMEVSFLGLGSVLTVKSGFLMPLPFDLSGLIRELLNFSVFIWINFCFSL